MRQKYRTLTFQQAISAWLDGENLYLSNSKGFKLLSPGFVKNISLISLKTKCDLGLICKKTEDIYANTGN